MRPKPKRPSPEERRNRRLQYRHLKKQGLKLFANAKLKTWEKRLFARSLSIVLETSLGLLRKPDETGRTVKKIIPIAVRELKPMMKEKLAAGQWDVFCKLIDWYAENPSDLPSGRLPERIMALGKTLDAITISNVGAFIHSSFFRLKSEERPKQRTDPYDFQMNLEFQLKHDIAHSLAFIRRFLGNFETG